MIKFVLNIAAVTAQLLLVDDKDIDDRKHNVKQIVEENGFGFEEHHVITDDGYNLTLHRILPLVEGAKPVLLQHGIEDCSV